MSSKERLDMDNVKTSSNLSFKQQKGCFVQRWMFFALIAVVLLLLVIVGLLVGYLAPCQSSNIEAAPYEDEDSFYKQPHPYSMLPRSVIPEHYTIQLQPYLIPDNFTFDGYVKIQIRVTEDTDNITVHVNELDVARDSVKLTSDAGDVPKIESFSTDDVRQFFILHLGGKLKANQRYDVEMNFKGSLNDQLSGFYRSSYKDPEGEIRWLATTQFQPTDARKAFPCFDEPALKATFNITLIHWKNMTSLSNMPIYKSEERDDEWIADHYETTVRMSTYLLAFIVSDFKGAGTPKFSVWSREAAIDTTAYALDIGPKILHFYEGFFDIEFPLPKTDMVAIPDFSAGAMENWGLITYRETALLFDPRYSSVGNKQRIATVVSHELAHQWFGNLVTPKWWDDLWLNEGFASYVEYLGVEAVHPDWMMDQQFVIDDVQDVMDLDCLKTSHPISVPVGHPDEINEIFDRISYGKGASLIRMMRFFLGNETFKKGLSNYLNAKKFDNAVQDDLWEHLTAVQDPKDRIDVKMVMDSWTLQTGYPVVTITRDYSAGTAKVEQSRFLLERDSSANMTKWEIPFTYTDSLNPDWEPKTKFWLHKTNGNISKLPGPNMWIIANVQEIGYYRVNYDEHNWLKLIEQLNTDHTQIHTINRAQILDDSMDLARSGLLSYHMALNATAYLINEQEYLPWKAALHSFSYIDSMLCRSEIYGKWTKYLVKQLEPLYSSLGWTEMEDENILKQYLRVNTLAWLCGYEHEQCITHAKELFQKWRGDTKDLTIISPNLRAVVYCTAVRHGGEDVWNFVWEQYLKAEVASEKDKLMYALACAREPWLLSRYLDWSLDSKSGIRRQDGSYIFRSVGSKIYGRDLTFNYIRDKWNKIFTTYGKSFFAISSLLKSVTSSLNTGFELQQLKDFYKANRNNTGAATRAFEQSIENAEANVKWMKINFLDIKKWLETM